MLENPTIEKIRSLRWPGFLSGLEEQLNNLEYDKLCFMDRLGMLIDLEVLDKDNKKIKNLISKSKMRQSACIEDLDFSTPRDLDRTMILGLADCSYIKKGNNLLITGPTGVGKSYLSCAFGNKACLNGFQVKYYRSSAFFLEMKYQRMEDRFDRFQKALLKVPLLIIDDFGLQKLKDQERLDLLDILDDRVQRLSTIIVTQLPLDKWHSVIGESTIADAIMDRFIHSAYQIQMKGESMRKKKKD